MQTVSSTAVITLLLVLASITEAAPAEPDASVRGTVFTVDSLADTSASGDSNPGDGACDDGTGSCTLRAAIEEANALSGTDTITFSVSGTLLVGNDITGGPLPAITDQVNIDAPTTTVDGIEQPDVVLDGTQLVGDGNSHGLRLLSGATGSHIFSLGIVNFPDNGVDIGSADDLWIDGCFIGVEPDGTTAANGGDGISGLSSNSVFGIDTDPFVLGNGNVLSGNGEWGLFLIGSNNLVAGNLVGTEPDGIGSAGNAAGGITIAGTGNRVGLGAFGTTGNVIAGNGGIGLEFSGTGGEVAGNLIGISINGSALGNSGIGIQVFGDDHVIGTNEEFGRNDIANNTIGIALGGSSTSADRALVQNNSIGFGSGALEQGNSGSGVNMLSGENNEIVGNRIINNGQHGIRNNPGAVNTSIRDNEIGFIDPAVGEVINLRNSLFGILNQGTAEIQGNVIGFNNRGIVLDQGQATIDGNHIGLTLSGERIGNVFDGIHIGVDSTFNTVNGNAIGNQAEYGIVIDSEGNQVTENWIGTDPSMVDHRNHLSGVRLRASAQGNHILDNTIAFNRSNGVDVIESATANRILLNRMHSNGAFGIDLGADGLINNDPGDDDTGPNLLMNHPEISVIEWNESTSQLTIEATVDTTAGNATYPLRLDFYYHDRDESNQGRIWLDSRGYSTPQAAQTFVLDFPTGFTGGTLRTTATDDSGAGSTSELSPEIMFGEFQDILFQDRFEE